MCDNPRPCRYGDRCIFAHNQDEVRVMRAIRDTQRAKVGAAACPPLLLLLLGRCRLLCRAAAQTPINCTGGWLLAEGCWLAATCRFAACACAAHSEHGLLFSSHPTINSGRAPASASRARAMRSGTKGRAARALSAPTALRAASASTRTRATRRRCATTGSAPAAAAMARPATLLTARPICAALTATAAGTRRAVATGRAGA
jgi:hypothetical protein